MNFPNAASFKLVGQDNGDPIPNVAVQLTLYASRKNDYHVGFIISDHQGLVTFTKADCLKEIEASRSTFLMDYASTLEECLPKVSLEVVPESQIKKSIELRRNHKDLFQQFWGCPEDFIVRLDRCENHLYVPEKFSFEENTLWQSGPLIIKVKETVPGTKGTS